MNIVCLTATYGRPHLVANTVAMFYAQDYPAENRRLLILDDAGQIYGHGPDWQVFSVPDRFPRLVDKYASMLGMLADWWPQWEAVAIMDDDDIFGPQWLSSHAAALESREHRHWQTTEGCYDESRQRQWSHPARVLSLYGVNVLAGQPPVNEPSAGRFWASAAISRPLLERTGGFQSSDSTAFDQAHLALWQREAGDPGRPDAFAGPHFVYGWGRARFHDSGLQRPAEGWQPLSQLEDPRRGIEIVPQMDATTRLLYDTIWPHAWYDVTAIRPNALGVRKP